MSRDIIKDLVTIRQAIRRSITRMRLRGQKRQNPNKQKLDVYWNKDIADVNSSWGEGTVWNEIQLLLAGCRGKVLDIACGTGGAIRSLTSNDGLEVFGCDISDFLLQRAIDSGVSRDRLKVVNATETGYLENEFDYSYSVGSLEHFDEISLINAIKESQRITKNISFHNVPTLRPGYDEFKGWLDLEQSYFNMPQEWWLIRFKKYYAHVVVLPSSWNDAISIGKWFVCFK